MVTRRQVLAHRLRAQGLLGADRPGILAIGLQDTPAGSGRIGLAARGLPAANLVLALTVRGAPHLHRAEDLPVLRSVLMPRDTFELATWLGGYASTISSSDVDGPALVRQVASVMRSVIPDGGASKGELSGLVSPRLPEIARPWCGGCGAHHIQDGLFRLGTLIAGLELVPDGGKNLRFTLGPDEVAENVDRASIVRSYLEFMGVARPADVTVWLSTLPHPAGSAMSQKLWDALDGLTEVEVDGRTRWALTPLAGEEPEESVLLLPPRDPYLLGEHDILVPDKPLARQIWKPAGAPGVLVVDGEIHGIWRQKLDGRRLTLDLTLFGKLTTKQRSEVEQRAQTVAEARNATQSLVSVSSG